MLGLYRSKSLRRFENTTDRHITDFLEKDNIKVLATASAQLFISTPHLDKWYKSSTGTICFLKDFTRKNTYFFRLYSLMQGQLWEQEIHSSFLYQKASYLFQYLTVNRFNYGFKFICEDEAERFYSCITKFSRSTTLLSNNEELIIDTNKDIVNKKDSTNSLSKIHGSSNRNLSANVCGSYLKTVSQKTISNQSLIQDGQNIKKHKSRRGAYSIDRKKKIEKSDISCPFRCSCTDLNVNNSINNVNTILTDVDLSSNNETLNLKNSVEISSSIVSNNLVQKYSAIVKRALSSASSTSTSIKQINQPLNKKNEIKTRTNPIIVSGSISSINSISNAGSSPRSIHLTTKLNDEIKSVEMIKEILIEYNVPINKKLIQVLREYINQYGSIDNFKKKLEQREEKNKFNAFVAASSAEIIGSINQINSPKILRSKFQTIYPNTPPSYSNLKQTSLNSTPNLNTLTPTTPIVPLNTTKTTYSTYQPLTPYSIKQTHHSHQSINLSERTPIRTNPLVTSCISSSNLTRTQTPSPLRFNNQFLKNNSNIINTPSSISITDSNAPPKPPRRSSLKVIN